MKQYRKLYIKVDSEHSAEFVASLDAALKGGWSRAHEAEEPLVSLQAKTGRAVKPLPNTKQGAN